MERARANMAPTHAVSLAQDGHLATAVVLGLSLALGLVLGLALPPDPSLPGGWAKVSGVLGWTCFGCWMVGWYPQIISNYQRRSVVGVSFDNVIYNWIGFFCYSVFNCALFFSKTIQEQYRAAHHGLNSDVRMNDVFFSLHANVMTTVALLQICRYERGQQQVPRSCLLVVGFLAAMVGLYGATVAFSGKDEGPVAARLNINVLGFLYLLSYIKLAMTLIKYIPQVVLNYNRKSTVGWNVANALTDLTGGLLSFAQQVLDTLVVGDPTIITGDLAKLGLGVISILYCLVLMFQHYVLYPERSYSILKDDVDESGSFTLDPAHDVA